MNELNTGLWKKQSKKGLNYYNGSIVINGVKYWISLFNNTKKQTEKHPDLNLLLTVAEQQNVAQQNTNNVTQNFTSAVDDPYKKPDTSPVKEDEDIPF